MRCFSPRTVGFWAVLGLMPVLGQTSVNLSGKVTDSVGTPIASATVKLEGLGYTATTDANGAFTLTSGTSIRSQGQALGASPSLREGQLQIALASDSKVAWKVLGLQGEIMAREEVQLSRGVQTLALPEVKAGLCFLQVTVGETQMLLQALSIHGRLKQVGAIQGQHATAGALAKSAATPIYDGLVAEKAGFQKAYVAVTSSDSSGITIKMLKENTTKFSFFIVSMKAIVEQSGRADGFGGDLSFGETGPGAGLRGADKICRTVAEKSLKGSSVKGWRAFLSVTKDVNGKQVNAIDRVGPGPWYDRVGRVMAPTKADLLAVRPTNGDPTIQLDLPNEDGVPNHRPDPSKPADDNHHMMTGSSEQGTLKSATSTCKDWTVAEANATHGKPGVGFAWPRGGRVSNQGSNWMSTYDAHGCGRGFGIVEDGPGNPSILTVGDGGGYGGFYCFALNP
jgi:Carboxypeptidase regulatory-like domain